MRHNMRGFTLIELLVAITIFAGVMILSLGAFARSATSAYKVSVTREKTEAARRIVDQISNDFQYIYAPQDPTLGLFLDNCGTSAGNITIKGFCVATTVGPNTESSAQLLLKYPTDSTYVKKTYRFKQRAVANNWTIYVNEQRNCSFNPSGGIHQLVGGCGSSGTLGNDLLDSKFVLSAESTAFNGESFWPVDLLKGFIKVNLSVKPVANATTPLCRDLASDSCYQLKTTLTPGGI